MAINLQGGYLSASDPAVTAPAFTMACWFKKTSYQNVKSLMSLSNGGFGAVFHALGFLSDRVSAVSVAGSLTHAEASQTAANNEWAHGCGVWSSNANRTAYYNGGAAATDTSSRSVTGINRVAVGRNLTTSGSTTYAFSGEVAEAAIWDVALLAEEVQLLAAGVSPLLLTHRLSNLKVYQGLIASVNQPYWGPSMVSSGSSSISAHPRILRPTYYGSTRAQRLPIAMRFSGGQIHGNTSAAGATYVAGVEVGTAHSFGEVTS